MEFSQTTFVRQRLTEVVVAFAPANAEFGSQAVGTNASTLEN